MFLSRLWDRPPGHVANSSKSVSRTGAEGQRFQFPRLRAERGRFPPCFSVRSTPSALTSDRRTLKNNAVESVGLTSVALRHPFVTSISGRDNRLVPSLSSGHPRLAAAGDQFRSEASWLTPSMRRPVRVKTVLFFASLDSLRLGCAL